MPGATTTQLQVWIDLVNGGDPSARGHLITHTCERLRLLVRRMLHGDFARLREREQTDDVLQNALLRLNRALSDEGLQIPTSADFFRLAAVLIRRELIDLARHHFGPARPRFERAGAGAAEDSTGPAPHDHPETTYDPAGLASWQEFHQQVEALPGEEREVFDLLWYQELTQAEAAALLRVSVPTVKRRWLSARLRLQHLLAPDTSAG